MENIKQLCFTKDGLLVDEFKYIFHDLFGETRSDIHMRIVQSLAAGPIELDELAKDINYVVSGTLSTYLEELLDSGFIARDHTWLLKSGKTSALSKYRLRDNYLRFYLKVIQPRLKQINNRQYQEVPPDSLRGWNAIMGLQFENLILNNRRLIIQALNIDPSHIINDNPFFQRKTSRQKGCQIDYLIQTKFNTLYVCEIKFNSKEIWYASCSMQLKKKISRISLPRGYSCVPVLIHAGEVTQALIAADYFSYILNLEDYFL